MHWISPELIFQNKHRLSIDIWEQIYGVKIPNELQEQYEITDNKYNFKGILLSPYAKKKNGKYLCCQKCHGQLKNKRNILPPKYAIANGFAIGSLPENKFGTVSNILSIVIAPTQPFMYVVDFKGGSNKKLQGTCSFFSDSSMLKKVRTGVSINSSKPSKK